MYAQIIKNYKLLIFPWCQIWPRTTQDKGAFISLFIPEVSKVQPTYRKAVDLLVMSHVTFEVPSGQTIATQHKTGSLSLTIGAKGL